MKSLILHSLILGALALTHSSFATFKEYLTQEDELKTLGARVSDFARYTEALPLQNPQVLETQWNQLVSHSFAFSNILTVAFSDYPLKDQKTYNLPLLIFGKRPAGHYSFMKAEVLFVAGKQEGTADRFHITPLSEIPLDQTSFNIRVSLRKRITVVEDRQNELLLVFPIGPGAFDEGVFYPGQTTLISPRFKDAHIDVNSIISERTTPSYFGGKPFIRIFTNNPSDRWTRIGFHAQPDLEPFVRAYDSHGCFRMPLNDLATLHDLLKFGPHRRTPIVVKVDTDDVYDVPYPAINHWYKTIKNAGSSRRPDFQIDEDNLVKLVKVVGTPPIDELRDYLGDDHLDLFNYDVDWRYCNKTYPPTNFWRRRKNKKCLEEMRGI